MARIVALLLTFATGVSGLVYEVTWERMLAVMLGSHAEATAAVLAFFLGGLAIGYSLFGRLSGRIVAGAGDRPRRLLLGYAAAEAAIGLYALVFEPLFGVARTLSLRGPDAAGLAFAWDAALAAALILPGAALMGATIPMLTQALSRDVSGATRIHAAIYGANTLGAFAGALAANYWLLPALGLGGALRAMATLNLAAGLGFAAIAAVRRPQRAPAPTPTAAVPLRLGHHAAAVCLLGVATMTLQTALIRLGGLAIGASLFTFANVVAVFVLCIALGSLAVGLLTRVPAFVLPLCAWALCGLFAALYLPLQDLPYYAHVLRSMFRDQREAFLLFELAVLASLFALIGPAVVLSGATLPLVFDRLKREHGELGDAAGRLYGWNTLGALVGALVGGHALYHWLDLHQIYRLAVAALALAAALLTPLPRRGAPGGRRALGMALALPALLGLWLLPGWSAQRLSVGAFRERQPLASSYAGPEAFAERRWGGAAIRFADDDPTASVVIADERENGRVERTLLTNGKSDGSTGADYPTMALAGLLPAWLALGAERSFVIGYGTGVTVGELAALDESREVIVAEISPAIAGAAPLFDDYNLGASRHPEVRIVRGDAYRVLLRSQGRFDVISSEPSNPWVNGVEMLYSVEFLRAARQRLAPGGVYCQWFHTYETDAGTVELVLRTYAAVFDHVAVWYGRGHDLLLMGFDDSAAALALERLEPRAARPDFAAGLARAGVGSFPALLAHELWPQGVLHALDLEGPLHTLLHPRLAHAAARAFYMGGSSGLPLSAHAAAAAAGRASSLVQAWTAARGGWSEAEREAFVAELCEQRPGECVTLLAQWNAEAPGSPALAALVARLRGRVALDQVAPLSRFFADSADPAVPALSVAQARREAERFLRFYHHAAPFRRAALLRIFDACAVDPALAEPCRQSRRSLERLIGPLAGPRPD